MLCTWGSSSNAINLSFVNGALDSRITFTRASTGTYFNSSGTLATGAIDFARFTYNSSTLAIRGLLNEPSRTNLALQSNTFTTTWTQVIVTTTGAATTSPDGTSDAWKSVIGTTATQNHYNRQTVTYSAGQSAFSLHLKKSNSQYAYLRTFDGTSNFWATFDLNAGTVSGTTGTGITTSVETLANGWYRVTLMFTAASGSGFVEFGFSNAANYSGSTFTGNGTDEFYFFGAQLEAAASASSYIATTTTTVTRAVDVLTLTASNGTYNVDIARESGTTSLVRQAVASGYVVPTDVSPVQSVTLRAA